MNFYRGLRYGDLACDGLVRVAFGQAAHYTFFPGGQPWRVTALKSYRCSWLVVELARNSIGCKGALLARNPIALASALTNRYERANREWQNCFVKHYQFEGLEQRVAGRKIVNTNVGACAEEQRWIAELIVTSQYRDTSSRILLFQEFNFSGSRL